MSAIIQIRTEDIKAARNELGRFVPGSAQSEMVARNRQLSDVLAAKLGQLIDSEIQSGGRAAASSGRLKQVSMSKGNVLVTPFYVGIGRPEYLDKSSAKYWRTFEEGSLAAWKRPFIGTQLMPIGAPKGMREAGVQDAGSRRKVPYPVAHGRIPGLRTAGGPLPWLGGRFIVRHEIEPANVYVRLGREKYEDLLAHGIQQARRYVAAAFGEENMVVVAGPPPGAPPLRFY